MHPAVAAVLERPDVSGWVRLHPAESATTVRLESRKALLTDGPFVDSKEFLAGLILVTEARHLDCMWPIWNVLDVTPEGAAPTRASRRCATTDQREAGQARGTPRDLLCAAADAEELLRVVDA